MRVGVADVGEAATCSQAAPHTQLPSLLLTSLFLLPTSPSFDNELDSKEQKKTQHMQTFLSLQSGRRRRRRRWERERDESGITWKVNVVIKMYYKTLKRRTGCSGSFRAKLKLAMVKGGGGVGRMMSPEVNNDCRPRGRWQTQM